MTVSTTTTRNEYTGAGGTKAFAFTFRCDDSSWVKVYLDGVLQSSGYSVAVGRYQDTSPGGTVTFTTAPDGKAVEIRRVAPLTQEVDLEAYRSFPAESLEDALDRTLVALQDEARDRADGDQAIRDELEGLIEDEVTVAVADGLAAEEAARIAGDAAEAAARQAGDATLGSAIAAIGAFNPVVPPGALSVKDYGAVGDGVADDTVAIRNTIALAASQGGGVVYLPPGTYKVCPQEARVHNNTPSYLTEACAFVIDADNITIQGAGRNVTKLSYRSYGDTDPETHWQNCPDGSVWRGHMFALAGTTDSGNPLRNFTLQDVECDGNCDYTGVNTFPANQTTGDGWDYTHMCVQLQNTRYIDGVTVKDCYIHRFRGENIGGGGDGFSNVEVVRNKFEDTNANFVSVNMSGRVAWNTFYRAAGHFVENGYSAYQRLQIHDNYGDTCKLNGVSVIPSRTMSSLEFDGNEGPVVIYSNVLKNCTGAGAKALGACNVTIKNNVVIDSKIGAIAEAYNGNNCENVCIENNEGYVIDLVDSGGSCEFQASSTAGLFHNARSIVVRNNRTYLTRRGEAAGGVAASSGMSYDLTLFDEPIAAAGNLNHKTTHADETANKARDVELTTTGDTTVCSMQPFYREQGPSKYGSFVTAYLTLRVITASTNVEAWVRYYDPTVPANRSDYLVGSSGVPTSLGVGVHHFGPILVTASRYGGATVALHVKAGTANQVFVTGFIRHEDI